MAILLPTGPNITLNTQINERKEQCEYMIIIKNIFFYCGQVRFIKSNTYMKYADLIHGRLITELNVKTCH